MDTQRSGSDDRNLDFLRAVAVLLVLVTHTLNATIAPENARRLLDILGDDGVVIFFVHTSIVLMRSIERTRSRGLRGWSQLSDFYVRRAFRIYPLAVLTVIAVVVLKLRREPLDVPFIPPDPEQMAANLTLTQNLWGARAVLAPLWSLPYEVEMYLLLPLLFVLVRRARAMWQLVALAALSIATAVVYLRLMPLVPVLWRLSLISFLPCFAAGIVAYRACQLTRPRLTAAAWPVIVLSIVFGNPFVGPDVMTGSTRIWFVAFGIAAFIPLVRELPRSAFTRSAHFVAKYSYGIYLTHIPVLDIVVGSMHREPRLLRLVVGMEGLVVLPLLLYHLVEEPMIRFGSRLAFTLTRQRALAHTLASTASAP